MAAAKTEAKEIKTVDITKKFRVKVASNPDYCGVGAGDVQFANGEAVISDGIMVNWFKEHKGYKVTEIKSEDAAETAE